MRKRYRIRSYLQQVEQAKVEAEFEQPGQYAFKAHDFGPRGGTPLNGEPVFVDGVFMGLVKEQA